jgi:hypothetical protein
MFRRLAKTTDRTFSSHGRGRKFNPPQNVEPHDIAILVRMHANEVEADLARAFTDHGLRLRNEARNVGDIAIQDLLGEELTAVCLPLLRLGATNRSADDWNATLTNMRFLKAVDPADDLQLQEIAGSALEVYSRVAAKHEGHRSRCGIGSYSCSSGD